MPQTPHTPKYVALVLMRTTPAWLALDHQQRTTFNRQILEPIFARYAGVVEVRLLDVEAFSGRCTDVALFETSDLAQYYFLIEELRDSELFSKPYFEVDEILVGLEGGFLMFEEVLKTRQPG